jgi:hypothetical protein
MGSAAPVITYMPEAKKPAFLAADLDDYGLDPYEFRIYMRIRRREDGPNGRGCDESIPSMAKAVGMGTTKARQALAFLTAAGLVSAEERKGESTVYRTTSPASWTPKGGLPQVRERLARERKAEQLRRSKTPTRDVTPTPDVGVPQRETVATPTPGVAKGNPLRTSPKGKNPPTPQRGKPSRKRDESRQVRDGFYRLWNKAKPRASPALADNREVDTVLRRELKRLGRAELFRRARAALAFVNTSEFHTVQRPCPPITLLRHLDTYAEQGQNRAAEIEPAGPGRRMSKANERLARLAENAWRATGGGDLN